MKPLLTTVLAIICSIQISFSQDTTFTEKDFSNAKVFFKRKDIPHFIRAKLNRLYGEKLTMADTGKKFQAGCVVRAGLPRSRLICFIKMQDRDVLFYEQGGRALFHICVVFEVDGHKVVKYASTYIRGSDLKSIETYLINNDNEWNREGL